MTNGIVLTLSIQLWKVKTSLQMKQNSIDREIYNDHKKQLVNIFNRRSLGNVEIPMTKQFHPCTIPNMNSEEEYWNNICLSYLIFYLILSFQSSNLWQESSLIWDKWYDIKSSLSLRMSQTNRWVTMTQLMLHNRWLITLLMLCSWAIKVLYAISCR